mmetsp:Transcript_45084/g.127250  ORF Transcript_45084/g.127250 Transcript_45084/m.127250 type:complete len:210 (-) Transcript_45084:155-784(-)
MHTMTRPRLCMPPSFLPVCVRVVYAMCVCLTYLSLLLFPLLFLLLFLLLLPQHLLLLMPLLHITRLLLLCEVREALLLGLLYPLEYVFVPLDVLLLEHKLHVLETYRTRVHSVLVFPQVAPGRVHDVNRRLLRPFNGVGLRQLTHVREDVGRYGLDAEGWVVPRPGRPQVHMGRGQVVNMKPDVLWESVFDEVFILKLVPSHVHHKPGI